jgi:DNA polymerase-1
MANQTPRRDHESAMFLILDGNNLAWAGYYGLERAMKPDSAERRDRVAMLGLGGTVLGAIARGGEPPGSGATGALARVAICFDEGRPLRRRAMYAPYQTGRERDPKFIANEPTILRAIDAFCKAAAAAMPLEFVRGPNTEADDLIAGLVRRNATARKRIVSTDRDFLQLIDERTSVYSPVKKVIIDETNFDEAVMPKGCKRVFHRSQYLDYRALVGDPSDDLPGVPGIGPLTAAAMLAHADLDAYFDDPAQVRVALDRKSDRIERAFADGSAREIIERNRTLMDLRLPAPSWERLDELTTPGAWDRGAFEAWYQQQRFNGVDGPALFARLESLAVGMSRSR